MAGKKYILNQVKTWRKEEVIKNISNGDGVYLHRFNVFISTSELHRRNVVSREVAVEKSKSHKRWYARIKKIGCV